MNMNVSPTKIIIFASIILCCFNTNAGSKFTFSQTEKAGLETAVIFVSNPDVLQGEAAQLDQSTNGKLRDLLVHNKFSGELGSQLHLQMLADVKDLLVVGTNSDSPLDASELQNLGGRIAHALDATTSDIAANIFVEGLNASSNGAAAHIAYGYALRNYHFDKYKSEQYQVESLITLVTNDARDSESLYQNDLQYLVDGVHMTRDLASEPGKSLYPVLFVEKVRAMFKGVKNIDIEVLDVKDMQKLNMGALMGVGKGSIHEPRMLVIEYTGGEKGDARLILADAVYYAQQTFEPKILLNIATLTGSAARALSDEYAAVVTRDFSLSEQMMEVGRESGELVWPLPLHPNHFMQIESDIADIKNSGAGNPGASIGAAVVATFIDQDLPWVHLDIAGVDWLSSSIDVAPKGSQGWGVRFMDQFVRDNK